ncbi:hypothetical protein [Streptomyces sp. NPDC000983]|uniref:hypothetical protein n=1 Tax=Streptomyces sp. NPDC000983 TaxID=3154373 RepID=UPI003326322C
MAVEQLPAQVREFANYLNGLMARLEQGGGWCGVFWQRDPEGMRACLDGREIPPWDVLEALLQDLGAEYGPQAAGAEAASARARHAAALIAHDLRPGGRDALGDRLVSMIREQRHAADRQAELGRSLAAATTRGEAEALGLDLAWARDDHARATARCAELRSRLTELDRRSASARIAALRREPARNDQPPGTGTTSAAHMPAPRTASATHRAPDAEHRATSFTPAPGRGPGRDRDPAFDPASVTEVTDRGQGRAQDPAADRGRGRAPDPASVFEPSRALAPETAPGGGRALDPAYDPASTSTSVSSSAFEPEHTPASAFESRRAPGPDPALSWGRGRAPFSTPDPAPGEGGAGAPRPAPDPASAVEPPRAPAPDHPTPIPDPTPTVPKQRKRRRGSARFAGIVEEETAPVTAPPAAPVLPEPHGTARRTPRGARFAGAAEVEEQAPPPVEPLDGGDRREVVGAVGRLVRLRQEGRSGEAHALLAEIAYSSAARYPLLAVELQRAGLGADWATLLWEAASLPAERLVAAADALVAAGRGGDGEQILRQGVARSAEEIGRAVLGLAEEGRSREIHALLDAYVRVRTPEEAARSVAEDPPTLVPLLLEAARGVSDERHWDLVHALRVAGFAA